MGKDHITPIDNPSAINTLPNIVSGVHGGSYSNLLMRVFQPVPKYLEQRGSTTYLTISRYKENYTVTAAYIPSNSAFLPTFPTGFLPIDEEFVKRAIINKFEDSFDGNDDQQVLGTLIYNYFIPPSIREYINKLSPENLVIQTGTEHDIPWELAFDGEEYWCIKYNMGRALGSDDETGDSEISHRQNMIKVAIISNPEGNLDAASSEAKLIKSHLEKVEHMSVDIFDKNDATKLRVLSIITSGDYDIIHYTGHAQFNNLFSEEPSSLKLYDNELTSNEILRLKFKKSSRPVIFANGCSTSATKFVGDRTVGLATSFITAGALAYIGSMWPVQDEFAAKFAAQFYTQLKTSTIGEALKQSRIITRSSNTKNQDWASYSFFGDPRHILR